MVNILMLSQAFVFGKLDNVRFDNVHLYKEEFYYANRIHQNSKIRGSNRPRSLIACQTCCRNSGSQFKRFVVTAAQEVAHKTIEEAGVIRLSAEDQVRFVDLLLNPHPPAPALVRAKNAHEQMFGPQ